MGTVRGFGIRAVEGLGLLGFGGFQDLRDTAQTSV